MGSQLITTLYVSTNENSGVHVIAFFVSDKNRGYWVGIVVIRETGL